MWERLLTGKQEEGEGGEESLEDSGSMAAPQPYAVSREDVLAAHARIAPFIHRTPVLTCASLSAMASAALGRPVRLHLKCELFQRSGSFKMRGAANAVQSLAPEAAARGVVTHSSGNHAQALALAASQRPGCAAHIVMPSNSPAVKKAATAGYGARVTECAPTQAAREAAAAAAAAATGATLVHPSEHPAVIAGQGTLALELLEQAPGLDALLVPVGGGGLVSGCALALAGRGCLVLGAEPAAADDAARSKAAGALLGHPPGPPPATAADGLRTTLGPNTWPIVRDLVAAIVCVSEAEIARALRCVYERAKLAIEPSAAVGVAAALSGEALGRALREHLPQDAWAADRPLEIGVVLCGGNSDVGALFVA